MNAKETLEYYEDKLKKLQEEIQNVRNTIEFYKDVLRNEEDKK